MEHIETKCTSKPTIEGSWGLQFTVARNMNFAFYWSSSSAENRVSWNEAVIHNNPEENKQCDGDGDGDGDASFREQNTKLGYKILMRMSWVFQKRRARSERKHVLAVPLYICWLFGWTSMHTKSAKPCRKKTKENSEFDIKVCKSRKVARGESESLVVRNFREARDMLWRQVSDF